MKINSGSCATILIIKENNYWVANVGDSRIIFIKDF
jgi:serine/threonine protein phosphatase PrpC